MQVLVTGGAGFIGSNLVRRLLADGHTVRVIDNLSTGHRTNLDGADVEFVEASITDLDAMRNAARGAEVVYHQAALPSVPRSVEYPLLSNEVNVIGTLTTLVASRDEGVRRVVYAGSSSAYGNTPTRSKHEDLAPNPLSPYAVAKLTGEYYCRAFTHTYGLSTVTLRYFNVFGPYQDPTSGYAAVVPAFTTALLRDQSPTIHGDGEQTRDFTFIDDVVEANVLAAAADDQASGEVINIAGGRRISINALFRLIQDATGVEREPSYGPARPGDVRNSLADITKARDLLGYEPRVDHTEALQRTVRWYAKLIKAGESRVIPDERIEAATRRDGSHDAGGTE